MLAPIPKSDGVKVVVTSPLASNFINLFALSDAEGRVIDIVSGSLSGAPIVLSILVLICWWCIRLVSKSVSKADAVNGPDVVYTDVLESGTLDTIVIF